MTKDIWIFAEKHDHLRELISAGIGKGRISAVIFGTQDVIGDAIKRGVSLVYHVRELPGASIEEYVPTLLHLALEHKPALILISSTRRGKAVAGRLAAGLKTSALTDILDFDLEDGAVIASHLTFGGGAVRKDRIRAETAVLTVNPGVYPPALLVEQPGGEIVDIEALTPGAKILVKEHRPLVKPAVNLKTASRVVAAGRGIAKQEDLALIEALAGLLGAEVACTRPLAEGLDWLPRERYIGISGANIKPDLYFGVGVSGQVQHTIGMHRSKVVVAVNKDRNAPIFVQADYGVTADLYVFLPELIKVLKEG